TNHILFTSCMFTSNSGGNTNFHSSAGAVWIEYSALLGSLNAAPLAVADQLISFNDCHFISNSGGSASAVERWYVGAQNGAGALAITYTYDPRFPVSSTAPLIYDPPALPSNILWLTFKRNIHTFYSSEFINNVG